MIGRAFFCWIFRMGGNGFRLGIRAGFSPQMCSLAKKFIKIPNVQFITKPAILPNRC